MCQFFDNIGTIILYSNVALFVLAATEFENLNA